MQSEKEQNVSIGKSDTIIAVVFFNIFAAISLLFAGVIGKPVDSMQAFQVIAFYNVIISIVVLVVYHRISEQKFKAGYVLLVLISINILATLLILTLNRTLDESQPTTRTNPATGYVVQVREGAFNIEWQTDVVEQAATKFAYDLTERLSEKLSQGAAKLDIENLDIEEAEAYNWSTQQSHATEVQFKQTSEPYKIQRWANGAMKSMEPLVKGTIHGVAGYWFEDGRLYGYIPYEMGQKHGIFVLYRDDGSIEQELSYKNGVTHGVNKWYDKDGELNQSWLYVRGEARQKLFP
ncbi:MAG: hypothetical protein CL565_02840 [Alphaproteobacteria bacterium]|nr:hypothetical protein [Alphaproteobacteria bacterium]|tara:strand:+ start:378 stop:1256 length:879 start_codon:yes stop_codon:yes gene_type:complete